MTKKRQKIYIENYGYAMFTKMVIFMMHLSVCYRNKSSNARKIHFWLLYMKFYFGGLSILFMTIPTYMVFLTCKKIFELLKMYCELKVTISDEIMYYTYFLCNFLSKIKSNVYRYNDFTYS